MGTEATTGLISGKKTPAPAPTPTPSLAVRARSRASRVADLDDGAAASTPSLRPPVAVPFLWEEAPGRPKPPHGAAVAGAPVVSVVPADGSADDAAGAVADHGYGHGGSDATERPVPLKLPPRLQVPSAAAERSSSSSPRTVLLGPYVYGCTGGGKRPPRAALRRSGSFASFRRTPSAGAGVGFFSRSKAAAAAWTGRKGGGDRRDDASCSSPSASSSSSSSLSYFGDDGSHGPHGRAAVGRVDTEEDEGAKGPSVRITRFRRNRSLPTMTTTHLWASIRRGVKQIAPWG